MPKTAYVDVKKLELDLNNFRTVPQNNEIDAIKAMIAIKSDRFYAILKSLIEDNYLPTESIIVLEQGKSLIVKEGNRRIAAMKIILGIHKLSDFDLSEEVKDLIKGLNPKWKIDNKEVPCTIFSAAEADLVDKVVARTHGKGESAGRFKWPAVATARHNRDANGVVQLGLDLLEKYLKLGKNLTGEQKDRWAGDYPLTILDELLRKYARFGYGSVKEIVDKYPKINYRTALDDMMLDIGSEELKTSTLRAEKDILVKYGLPPIVQAPPANSNPSPSTSGTPSPGQQTHGQSQQNSGTTQSGGTQQAPATGTSQPVPTPNAAPNATPTPVTPPTPPPPPAMALNDPKRPLKILKLFIPRGTDRDKVKSIRDEMLLLKVDKNPLAFCFLLRSMFEISAKAYAKQYRVPIMKDGKELKLADLLKSIKNDICTRNPDPQLQKDLTTALRALKTPDTILSVTSLNQLVHSLSSTVKPGDIAIEFGNIFPLLEAMN